MFFFFQTYKCTVMWKECRIKKVGNCKWKVNEVYHGLVLIFKTLSSNLKLVNLVRSKFHFKPVMFYFQAIIKEFL